jgi:YidC/Oxa1 family membrane protein insertase
MPAGRTQSRRWETKGVEKRVLVAAFLSLVILIGWEVLFPGRPAAPPGRPPVPAAHPVARSSSSSVSSVSPVAAEVATPAAKEPVAAAAPPISGAADRTITVEEPFLRASFRTRGAMLSSLVLTRYKDDQGRPLELVHTVPAGVAHPFAVDFGPAGDLTRRVSEAIYAVEESSTGDRRTLKFRYSDGTLSVEKDFTFDGGYLFDVRVSVAGTEKPWILVVGPALRNLSEQEKSNRYTSYSDVATYSAGHLTRDTIKKLQSPVEHAVDAGGYVGLEDAYFLAALLPKSPATAVVMPVAVPIPDQNKPSFELAAGLTGRPELSARAYFGPKDLAVLEALHLHLEETINFGWLGIIARPLLLLLKWFYKYVRNYGVAILLVTLALRLAMYPLMQKSYASMKKMQKLTPKMNAIRDRYRKAKTDPDQRAKMNQEIMALYQAEGVNPMGGCLPLLLQMPILFAFYYVLERAIELRHAMFIPGWIVDLSAKDPTYILVILMTVSMFVQQAMTPSTADPMQKKMFMVMPLLWGFLFKDMPSGLVLYWMFSNVLTIGQQMLINRMTDAEQPAAGPARRVRAGGKRN